MSTFYGTGTHRIIYKAENFITGLTVTSYFWNPSLVKSALKTLIEISDGFYYLDYSFSAEGNYFSKFFEGGTATASGFFKIKQDVFSQILDLHDEAFGKWSLNHNTNTLTLYKANGVDVLKAFNLSLTGDDVPSYIGRVPQ